LFSENHFGMTEANPTDKPFPFLFSPVGGARSGWRQPFKFFRDWRDFI